MLKAISFEALATVSGGINDAEIRGLAAANCPVAYQSLKNKPMSKLTRSDVQPCLDELNPLKRMIATPKVDAFFAGRGK